MSGLMNKTANCTISIVPVSSTVRVCHCLTYRLYQELRSSLFIPVGLFHSHCPHLFISLSCSQKNPLKLQKSYFVLGTEEKEGQGSAEELHCREGCLLPQYLFSSFINFLLEIDTWLQLGGTEHGYGIVRNAGSHLSACQDLHNHTNIPNGQTDSCKGACQSSSAQLCHSNSIIVQERVHKHAHTTDNQTRNTDQTRTSNLFDKHGT